MGNFLYKIFWKTETPLPPPPPPPIFLLEDLKPNKSNWSFYKKKEEEKSFEYEVPDIIF